MVREANIAVDLVIARDPDHFFFVSIETETHDWAITIDHPPGSIWACVFKRFSSTRTISISSSALQHCTDRVDERCHVVHCQWHGHCSWVTPCRISGLRLRLAAVHKKLYFSSEMPFFFLTGISLDLSLVCEDLVLLVLFGVGIIWSFSSYCPGDLTVKLPGNKLCKLKDYNAWTKWPKWQRFPESCGLPPWIVAIYTDLENINTPWHL